MMYIDETTEWDANYAKHQVDQIASNFITLAPITVFAPSGFGKSVLLKYLAYNQKYRKRYKFKNILLAYTDATELVAAVKYKDSATTLQPIINSILARVVIKTLVQNNISIKREDITKLLEELFTMNRKVSLFLIIDGLEQLAEDEFAGAREQLKYIRDNFRNRFEYIFGIGTLKGMEINRKQYGSLSTLIGQQIVVIALFSKAKFIDSLQQVNRWYSWFIDSITNRKTFEAIDNLSGGYAPYIKYLLRNKYKVGKKLNMSPELASSSERLLQPLNVNARQILGNLANGQAVDKYTSDYQMLKRLDIIKNDQIFSPILAAYLINNNGK